MEILEAVSSIKTHDEYEAEDPMYDEEDIAYCNGLLSDGRSFLAEPYFSKIKQTAYLVIVIIAHEMLDLEEHELKITKLKPHFSTLLLSKRLE